MNNISHRLKRVLSLSLLAVPVWIGPVQAQTPTNDVLEYGNVVNDSALKGDPVMLAAARLNLPTMLKDAEGPNDLLLLYYTAGYASWEYSIQAADPDDATGAIYDAAAQLKEAIGFTEKGNEAHLLEANVLMAMIHAQLLKLSDTRVPYDPAVGMALMDAQTRAPKNPRIALAQGIVAFLAPAAFGAGPTDAEQALKRAQTLFAAEPDNKPWPNWGKAQTEAWLGQVLAKKGDAAGARAAYQRALALRPEYTWVKKTLLPALKP